MQHTSPAIFVAGSLGLDFLNSIATPVDMPIDWLDNGDGLLSWLAQAKLVPADTLDELKGRAMPGELDKVADQARALREWFRGFVRKHMGRSLAPKVLHELGPLNRLLERDEGFGQISRHSDGDGDRFELQMMRRWRSPEALLILKQWSRPSSASSATRTQCACGSPTSSCIPPPWPWLAAMSHSPKSAPL
jgi:hypothetical protein